MYKVRSKHSPNNLRDINIAIAYHNTGRTMGNVANEFGISCERVRQIHTLQVRYVNHCNGMPFHIEVYKKYNHNDRMASYLKDYKQFLIGQGFE
jgi:hypothetical protein